MKNLNILFLASQQASNGSGSNMFLIIAFIIIAVIMYFGMIRPQKKQQQKRVEMMNQLKKGDRVVMVDGLHGKIDSVNNKDKTVVIDADGIYLTFARMAVRQVLPASSNEPAAKNETQTTEAEEKKDKATVATDSEATQPSETDKEKKQASEAESQASEPKEDK